MYAYFEKVISHTRSHVIVTSKNCVYKRRKHSVLTLSSMAWLFRFSAVIFHIMACVKSSEISIGHEHSVFGKVGDTVVMPCEVDLTACGRIYVITWTKHVGDEWLRVYLYSDTTHSRPLGTLFGRAHFVLHNNSNAEMHLRALDVADEGTYKCDVTYVQGKCPSLTFTKLFTLMTPKLPELYVDGSTVKNTSTLGPFTEGSTFVMDCRSTGGRPPPKVTISNGTHVLPTKIHIDTTANGSSDLIATTRFVLSRWDLESRLVCRVQNNASTHPQMIWIKLDIHVKPASLRVRGPTTPVVAGEMVSLTCTVEGSRPQAVITWFNRSKEVEPQPISSHDLMSDSTYRTSSTLVFIASRHDHQGDFCCQGMNEVQKIQQLAPLLRAVTLDVLYPPSVSVTPFEGLIVNETGSATLTCAFTSNPPNVTEVTWYKDGRLLQMPASFGTQLHNSHQQTTSRTRSSSSSSSSPNPQLFLNRVLRRDAGSYTCAVRNAFGRGNSTNAATIDVLYPPTVLVEINPEIAAEAGETSFACRAEDGNPMELTALRWFHNGDMIDSMPVAEEELSDLKLKNLTRNQAGNYTCQGLNRAGWSKTSIPRYFDVHYPPGSATITRTEIVAIKGQTVTLNCQLEDSGHPPASKYIWEFPARPLSNASLHPHQGSPSSSVLTMDHVTAASEGIYFCAGRNDVGTGPLGHFNLKLGAPPAFVRPLPRESGAARNVSSVRLMCHIECDPLCNVTWYRGTDSLIESKFFLTEKLPLDADPKRNVLKSVVSTLTWSLSHLPAPSFNFSSFTCISSSNELGPGVNSSTLFRIEYPPENIYVSSDFIDIMEGEIPEDVQCTVSAFPPGHFLWTMGDAVLSRSPILSFNSSVTREMAGNYSCNVRNPHGHARADLILLVNHRPDCSVRKDYDNRRNVVLICRSTAYPDVTNFTWFRDNTTLNTDFVKERHQTKYESSIVLMPNHGVMADNLGKYSCVSTNALGSSEPCRLQITSLPAPSGWVLQEENLIIVAGVAGGLLILMVLLVITTAVAAVRRRITAIDKPDLNERQSFEVRGQNSDVNLCSSITPILPPPGPPPSSPLDPPLNGGSNSPCVMIPLLSEMKTHPHSPLHHLRAPIITPILHSQHHNHNHSKNSNHRRFLHNNCSDMYRVRDICQVDHGNNAG